MRLITIFAFAPLAYAVDEASTSINPDGSKTVCVPSIGCYPSVFDATDEFQVVREGQSIPAGLHVKMNLETGLKEARLLSPQDAEGHDRASELALVPVEEAKDDVTKGDNGASKPYPPTTPVYGSDVSNFDHALASLSVSSSCTQESQDALDALEDLAHELEFGLRLIDAQKTKGLEVVLHLLQSPDPHCRSKAALVLGSALRNNENALAALPADFSLSNQLLQLLEVEGVANVQNMLVYALSAVMPLKSALDSFRESDGHTILFQAYNNGSDNLKGKIASFIEDHFAQTPMKSSKMIVQDGSAYESRLLEADVLGKWCDKFQDSLMDVSAQGSTREKLLSSVNQIRRSNMDMCTVRPEFLNYLAKESKAKRSDASDPIPAMALSAQSLFGNPKASRKHHADFL